MLSEYVGSRRPLRPELLFEALHRRAVDYVVIGGFASVAHRQADRTEHIELTIEETIENCTTLAEALLSLNAQSCLGPRDRKPLDSSRAATRIFEREYVLDTAAGGVDLRLPRSVLGCPPYPELCAESVHRPLGGGLVIRVACLDHLAQMRHPFRLDPVLDDPEPQFAIFEHPPIDT